MKANPLQASVASANFHFFRLSLRLRLGWSDTVEARVQRARGLHMRFVHRREHAIVFGIDAPGDGRRELARLVRLLSCHPGVRTVRWEVVPTTADSLAPFA
ncbi:hypothetical protein [Pseudoxanthomonas beigongshangi]|jgi:hypothetical protein